MSLDVQRPLSRVNRFFLKLKKLLLHGSSFALRPYEQVVLDAWRKHLSPAANVLLVAQLKHLVSYQRQAGEKLLCFFPLETNPYPGVPMDTLFPCTLAECVVARVHLISAGETEARGRIKAEIVLHKGRIIFVEFNQPPGKKLAHGAEAGKVEILRDPMIAASDDVVDTNRRDEILATIQSTLPDDYLRLIGEGTGVSINEWAVYGVQEIRKIPQRDGNYYLLAEREGMGAVGVKEEDWSGQLYYLDYGDDRGEKITVGFRKFLEEFDGGKVEGRF